MIEVRDTNGYPTLINPAYIVRVERIQGECSMIHLSDGMIKSTTPYATVKQQLEDYGESRQTA